MTQNELSPKVSQANQAQAAPTSFARQSPAQIAWLQFVEKVERGELVDPSGQYVAKGTQITGVSATGHRALRPKYDAATSAFAQHYTLHKTGKDVVVVPSNSFTTPDNPPVPCEGPDCLTYGPTSTFISSEGLSPYSGADNPGGYIYDLKVGRGYTQGDHDGIPSSYTVLCSDLNKGAGGPFIYIGFTRVPGNVSQNPEIIYNDPYNSGPVTLLGISKKYNFNDNYSYFAGYSYPVWADTGMRLGFKEYDLNQDVGGAYIHARLSKYTGWGTPIEIGVLSSNSSTAQPPIGWTRVSTDLNEGAGGDYIYFCAKAH